MSRWTTEMHKVNNFFEDQKKQSLQDKFLELKQKDLPLDEMLDELFTLYQKIPNWEQFPMPEKFYKRFNVKKIKPSDKPVVMNTDQFQGGEYQPIEYRNALPGGVREVVLPEPLEVKTTLIPDETSSDTPTRSYQEMLTRPREDSSSESQHE